MPDHLFINIIKSMFNVFIELVAYIQIKKDVTNNKQITYL